MVNSIFSTKLFKKRVLKFPIVITSDARHEDVKAKLNGG